MKMFNADKTRMIGLPYSEKKITNVKPFSSNTGTDGQTDIIRAIMTHIA